MIRIRIHGLTEIGKLKVTRTSSIIVMGVINVSPESFYKGSIKTTSKSIAKSVEGMERQGAKIIDIGAMSTAPYLRNSISIQEEIVRIKRAIRVVRKNCSLPISVDTPRSAVAMEAIKLGVDCLNDISGLKYDKKMAALVAEANLPVILGAYGGNKRSQGKSRLTTTGRLVNTVKLLKDSIDIAKEIGIKNNKLIVDPSIGFFRASGRNPFFTFMKDAPWYIRDIEVISRLGDIINNLPHPICISVSRKSFIGEIFGLKTKERLIPSVVLEVVSALNGAKIIRTHNVKEIIGALTVCKLIH